MFRLHILDMHKYIYILTLLLAKETRATKLWTVIIKQYKYFIQYYLLLCVISIQCAFYNALHKTFLNGYTLH